MKSFYRPGIAAGFALAVLKVYWLHLTALLLTAPQLLFAEGSKELNQSGGYRPYLNGTSSVASLTPFPTPGTVKVYVNAGERIYLGSSAQGIGNGRINLRAPNGQTYTSGASTTTGRIFSRSQEVVGPSVALLDGGYTPYIVTADQSGVWEIDFVSPNAANAVNPTAILASANWTQPTNTCYIAAFDVSVRNTSNAFVPGRVYTNVFNANLGSPTATFNAVLNVLTNDGYIYTVNNNAQAGYIFTFVANNKGFRSANGSPTYKSVDDMSTLNMKDPRTADTETDITHKLFFNTPSSSLPPSSSSVSGTEWLLTTAPTLTVSNITFRGVEGTTNIGGTSPAGGYISFTASNPSNYNIDLDINGNGVYTDAVDKRITGTAVAGSNTAYWDGTNGQGVKVTSSSNNYNTRVILLAGEVHFPFIDVENNPNGIIITRTNGSGAPNNIVYWDDTGIATTGTPSSPVQNITNGISSATNGHKWGSTAYSGTDFGNENGLDTWAYLQSPPTVQALSIQLREADLETVSIAKAPTTVCQGQTVTYTVTVRNNGPNNVTGASYFFTFPATLTNVSVNSAVTSGTGSVSGGTVSGTQYTATLNMNNAAVITFTITGTVSAFPPGGSLSVSSAVMRPVDVTDPDATNPDAAPPTDPQAECDASPSGTGCNNIKTDVLTVSQLPSTANAGTAQVLCAATTATLAGNTPSVGTGAWSKVSGPGNPVITNVANANTTVTGLTTGVYVFRWTISNGACAASTSDVQITVQAALASNTVSQPAATIFCASGDPAVITGATPTGGSGTYSYQWQQSADNTTFTDITGATSASYDPGVLTATTYFRRQVTSGSCTTPGTSNVVTITIQPAITGNTITAPATTAFCGSGDAAVITGTAPSGGAGAYTYQWQSSLDNNTWSDLSGATAQSYDPVPVGTTVYYRRLVTSGTCTNAAISNVVTISVSPSLTPGAAGVSQEFCVSGDPAAFTVTTAPTGGTGTYTYQWQSSVSSASSGFTDIAGANAATYDAPAITQTTYYRRIARSGVCADGVSNVITVTINPALAAGVIAGSQSFCASGDPAAFTVTTAASGGNGTYSYQWQSSVTSSSAGFTDIAGATGATFDAPALSQTTYFRRITRSATCADAVSNALTVTVLAAVSNNSIGNAQTICTGTAPALLSGSTPSGGNSTYTYLWESSTGSGSFAPAAGTNNGQNYTPPALTQTTTYRRTVTSDGCSSSTSNIIQVTAVPATTVANAGADQGPSNAKEAQLSGNIPAAGAGLWSQVSGPNAANIVNTSSATTSITGLVAGTYTFRWTISNPPCASSTDDVQVIVNAAPVANNDAATTNEDVALNISILANDTDNDGTLAAGSITIVSQPAHGTLSVSAAGVVTFTPTANYNGTDVFSYTVADNLGAVSNVATVSLTINQVSDPPVAADDQINVQEDVTTNIPAPGVLDNDSDPDGGLLTAVIVTPVSNGSLTLNTDGSFSYTPPADFTGNAVFTYRVCDASGNCDTATVTLEVGNENDVPVANADSYTATEDNILNVNAANGVLANDTDADNDPLTANLVTAPASGTLTLNADGSFRYVPAEDFNGPVSFVYSACDASGACDTATVNITVNNVNDTPIAGNDAYSTNEDAPVSIAAAGVLSNDSDIDGNTLSVSVVNGPANGTLTLNPNGSFVYTPTLNFNGVDRFTYRVCDNGTPQLCDTAEVSIVIRPVNDTVVAANDTYTTAEDTPLTVAVPGVLSNDTDPEGDGLTVTLVQAPARGSLSLNAEGNFVYVPNANYNGSDAFIYSVCDPQGACDTATATINITAVNDAPVVANVNYNGTEDVPLVIAAPGLIGAAQDQEGGTLTASLVAGPGNGTITVNPDGSFTYTPPADFNGTATFTFRICDNGTPALCDTATATITVAAVNDRPSGTDDTFTVAEDTPLTTAAPGVLSNDTDPDGDPLSAAIVAQPANGTLILTVDGSFTYTPRANFNGTDSYTYRVCDNNGGCDTATVNLNVTAANDAPVSSPVNYTVTEDLPLTVNAPGILIHAYDPDGDALTVTLLSGPANGAASVNANGSFTYTPAANFNGSDTFYYRVCDPSNVCDTGIVVLAVQAVNDVPSAVNDTYTLTEDDTLTIAAAGVLTNDTDPDGDALTATVLTQPLNGRLTLNANGSLEYIPGADFNGADSFTYIACDGNGQCDTATVTMNVTAENDAPITANDVYTTAEDLVLNVPAAGVLFNDADKEGNPMTATLVTPPASGNLVLNADGSFVYTPQQDFNGTVSFTYQACDNGTPQLCSTGSVTINVTAANDPPNGVDDSYTLTEDTPLTIAAPGLLSNDTDADGNPLQATGIFRQPAQGTVSLNANGSFTYTPRSNYTGVDSFVYNLCDNNTPAACDTAVVHLTITAENDAPALVDDNYSTSEDNALTISPPGLLFNDADPDGNAITVSGSASLPAHGTLALNADGSFIYTPAANFQGIDSFTYRGCDASGACDTGTVRIVVSPVNDAPVTVPQTYTTAEDTQLSVPAAGILANDSDPDGDNLSLTLQLAPVNGTVTLNADGSFVYLPNNNYNGSDLFVAKVCDVAGSCVTDTTYLTITAVNDTVIARNDLLNTLEDVNVNGDASGNDDDPENDALTFSQLQATSNGAISLNADGTFTYNPNANFNGLDTAVYRVCDPSGACDTALIIINVGEDNDPPVGTPDSYTVNEDEILTVAAPGVLSNDTDPDPGSQLHSDVVTTTTNGTLILQADGSFTYQPNPGFNGTDQFTYNVCDANNACVPVVVSITVDPVNDAPIAVDDSLQVSEDTQLTGNVSGNDSDPENNTLTISLVAGPSSGTVNLAANGDFTYTPSTDFNGVDMFQYRVCDNGTPSLCDTAVVMISVTAANDAPVTTPDQYTVNEDNTLTVPVSEGVLNNDADPDGDVLVSTLQSTSNGSLTLNNDGSFIYRPNRDFNGTDQFIYEACDLAGSCTADTVTLNVVAVNDPPIAVDDYFARAEDTVITFPPIVALINDIDVDGDTLSGHPFGSLTKGTYTSNPDGTYTYRPAPDFHGLDSIQYEVCDGKGGCDTGIIRLEIIPRNDAPIANQDAYEVQEDSTLFIPATAGVLLNDTDVDGEPLVAVLEQPSSGTLQLSQDGSFSYRPNSNYNGLDTFSYRACDVGGACDTALVILTVLAVNDAPIAINDRFARSEDTVLTFPPSVALINDIDPDGDVLSGRPIGTLTKGTYTSNPDGTYTYRPGPNFHGLDSIQYQVCDPGGLCDTGVIVLEITPVNDKPVAIDDEYTVSEDSTLNIADSGIQANDNDIDGDALVATVLTDAQNGTFTLNPSGSFTYTPNADYAGADSVIYSVCDLSGVCDTAVIRITVQAVADPPVAGNDAYTTAEDTPLTLAAPGLLVNDSDPDGTPLLASLLQQAANGTVAINNDGSFTYTPILNFTGRDVFTYQVCDTTGGVQCATATATIDVTAVNDAPVGNADNYSLNEDTILTVNTPGVMANDSNIDNDVLQVSLTTAPLHGNLQLSQNGSFSYTPVNNYNGRDSAVYTICDPYGLCDTAMIRFTVDAVNDPPIAVDDQIILTEDTVVIFDPASAQEALANDSDPDGDTLTGRPPITLPNNGTYVQHPDGSITYTPNPNFNGIDSVQYAVCDPGGLCDTAWIRLIIQAVNDAPVAQPDAYQTDEDITLSVPAPGVEANDSDVDGDVLNASVLTATQHGTVTLNADRSFSYIPEPGFNGVDSFIYIICDPGGLCDTSVARITVNGVNDAPVGLNNAYSLPEDSTISGNVLDNDSDPDGDPITASIITNTTNGTLTLNVDGTFTYVPAPGFNGNDGVTYRICDNGTPALCDTMLISFIVTAVNDAPIAVRDSVAVTEDIPATGNVLTNDSDPEGDAFTASLVTAPVNGTVVLNADGSFTYTPNANFNGLDSLIYQVCDNGVPSLCDTATLIFNVSAANDAPIAVRDSVVVTEDIPGTGNVLTNDSDPEGNALTASLVTAPVNGTVVLNADGSFTYTPNANFNGADSLIYQVCDNGTPSLCDTATLVFNVSAVNEAPIAVRDSVVITEDVPGTGNVLTNDSDPEGNALTASLVTAPVNGTVVLNADGSFTYTPNANFNGADSLIYQVCDNGTPSLCDTAALVFNVSAVNDTPIAVRDSVVVTEDVPGTGNVLTNDSDPEGNALTASLVTAPVNGTVVLNSDGSLTYTPNANYTGLDSLIYQVCDNGIPSLCDTATVIFNVAAGNDAPIAVRDTVAVTEDTPATGNVLTNDNDPEGDALTASLVTAPVNGTVVLNADGSLTYTPNANYSGLDSLIYQVCDNGTPSLCDTAVVIFNVTTGNDAPIAVRDTVAVTEDTPATGNVLSNDSDPEGDALTASLVTAPVNGTVVLNADGSLTYTPNANYSGLDSLIYQVCDNGTPSLCDTAIVIFNVAAGNDAPIAIGDSIPVTEDTPATSNVLTNDSDPEGDALTASLVTAPVNGTVVLNADGSLTYTPNANYSGLDSLIYQVCDNGTPSLCDTATVIFDIAAGNDAPIAVGDTIAVTEDTPATANVLANDSDPEGNTLTASLVTAPVNGTVVLNADGSLTYTPNANSSGLDSLIYQVCDNGTPSLCDTAIVIFNVAAGNDAPIAVRDTVTVAEDTPATGNVLSNDNDPEGDALTASLVTAPVNGTVVLNADGSLTYTPNANYSGLDSLIYQVCDNGTPSLCDTATVIFNVAAGNDAPIAVRDTTAVTEDTPATGNVLTNDSDPEGNALTASLVTAPVNGTVVLNADGSLTYTPNANYSGLDSLIYQVCDNGTPSLCDTATVIFNVAAGSDAPIAVRDTIAVTEDTPATGNVLTNDSDPEGDALTASLVTAPINGTVVLNADGSLTYTPNADYSGLDSLIYQVCDNGTPSLCDTVTVIFNVAAGNDAPIAVGDTIAVTEDTPATGNVLTNDSDPEGNALTASLVTAPVNGTVVLNADGSLTYTPNANYTGLDSLIYQVCDNGTPSLCDTATVIFNIAAGNDAPIAVRDTIAVTEDTPATGNALINDSDPDGNTLTTSLVTAPVNGTVVFNADGSLTYTPNANYSGLDSLIYSICDNGTPSLCDTTVVIFNITGTNEPPIAVNDTFNIPARQLLNGNILTNDTDPQGASLTASLISNVGHGTLQLNANGTFTYQSDSGFVGLDSFVYRACNGPLCDTATAYINVTQVNTPRSAIGAALAVNTPVLQPDGSYRITYTIRLENYGNTILSSLQALLNLSNTFPSPVTFRKVSLTGSAGLTINPAYNGSTDLNLLIGQNSLAVDSTGQLMLIVDIVPNGNFGPFLASVQASAIDPEGSTVTDTSDNGTNPDPNGNANPNEPAENTPTPVSLEAKALVGIAKAAAEPQLQINGDYNVTFTFIVRNMGNVAANNVQISDELTGVFTTPLTFRIVGDVRATGGLQANNSYNGSNISTLLAAGSTVVPGASDTVQVTIGISPNKQFGTYNNSATFTALADVTGEGLTDVSTNGLEADPDNDGNPDENTVTPVTLAPTRIRIPEGFSPNGDGKNDKFVIGNLGTDKVNLEIYNRWGNVVYRNIDYKNDWDGKCNQGARFGEDVPDGTYYYIIIVNGTERFVNFITIMR